jgi:osmotically-inducible protein OsmY
MPDRKGVEMSSNAELEQNVGDELTWDPKVDANAIAVDADDGRVRLRGTVGSFRQKREAQHAAERVHGVKKVENDLEVRLLTKDRKDDADLRGDVLQALILDSSVPVTVDAEVEAGIVTLTGTAEWQFQRDEAELRAGNVAGVLDVINAIELAKPGPAAVDVEHAIKDAFKRAAKLDAEGVTVSTSNGTVTLRGYVASWAEHDQAVDAAWSAPGVTKVQDHLIVEY